MTNQSTSSYCVLVPVLNESVKIKKVLQRLKDSSNPRVVVIDDGSTDDSAQVASSMGAHVISLGGVQGVGQALLIGMRYIAQEGFEFCVIMAGNDKDEPKEIPRLLGPLIEGEADFVQGSRWLEGGGVGGDMPDYRQWATQLHPWLFSLFVGKKITESTNGFRAFRCQLIEDSRFDFDQDWLRGYELEPYFLFKTIKFGYRHKEVPCTKIYPLKKLGITKMRPFIDWWNILKPIFILGLGLKK